MAATDDDAQAFAAQFRTFLEWIHGGSVDRSNEVVRLVTDFLGEAGGQTSVVSRSLPPFEQVNLQTALNAWMAVDGRQVGVHGFAMPPHFQAANLQQLMTGEGLPPLRLTAPSLSDLPNGPGSTLACLSLAALLVTDARGRYVLLVAGPTEHETVLRVEIAGLGVEDAQAVHGELDVLRSALNVYRGQVLDVSMTPMGGVALTFAAVPATTRGDVVLPDGVLTRVERHALGIAAHRQALLAAGQHLKRGLLLYGPPGTGKTHTTRYLVGAMTGYTRLLLTGRALHAVGSAAELARDLQPAVMVLEDVDLVAEDRSFGPGNNPVLFDLLDAMDGAAPDADLLFLLTTNRSDLLEPALAARPGRVDVAVEIELPDADARRKLFALYGNGLTMELSDAEIDDVVRRCEGVTASFLKELLRRAVLESLMESSPLQTLTGAQVSRAMDDLLDSTQRVTRSLLGVGSTPEPAGSAGARGIGSGSAVGWTAYTPLGPHGRGR